MIWNYTAPTTLVAASRGPLAACRHVPSWVPGGASGNGGPGMSISHPQRHQKAQAPVVDPLHLSSRYFFHLKVSYHSARPPHERSQN